MPQSVSSLQELLQPVVVQAFCPQSIGDPAATHIPVPLHVLPGVKVEPEQVPAAHAIPLAYR